MKYKCTIYKKRPDVCKKYPEFYQNKKECSFSFDKITGERKGICSRCGECCILYKDIFNIGSNFVKGAACKYLQKMGVN